MRHGRAIRHPMHLSAAPRRDPQVCRTAAQQVYLSRYVMARRCEGRRTRYRQWSKLEKSRVLNTFFKNGRKVHH